jgi:hypothetical protein
LVLDRPDDEELEVSLFGCGFGEGIAVHLGQQAWMVVDSCVSVDGVIQPLDYLRSLGVALASEVELVVATHWHADHVKGISQIVEECRTAEVALSSAFTSRQFRTLIGLLRGSEEGDDVAAEYAKVLELLDSRARAGRPSVPAVAWTFEGRQLVPAAGLRGKRASVQALSPSNDSTTMTLGAVSGLVPMPGSRRRPIAWRRDNHGAIVLWVSRGDHHILLGSDLEETGHAGTGWSAVASSTSRTSARASLYKVAHHGSRTAESPAIWNSLVGAEPVSIVTEWRNGGSALPSARDRVRICERSARAFITSDDSTRSAGRPSTRSRAKAKAMVDATVSVRAERGLIGHVRARIHPDETSWRIAVDGVARDLCPPPH